MGEADWQQGFAKSLGVYLNGGAIQTLDARAEPVVDDSFYLAFNASEQPLPFRLPDGTDWGDEGPRWLTVLDTDTDSGEAHGGAAAGGQEIAAGEEGQVAARSLRLFRRLEPDGA